MKVVSEDPRIIDLDGYVYLVKDKFICFKQGTFDLSNADDRLTLLDYADIMYTAKDGPRYFGKDSVCILSICSRGGYYVGQCHMKALPNSSSKAIEEARYEFGL